MKKFDPDDIPAINEELHSLLMSANFSSKERSQFVREVAKKLAQHNISVDCLR